MLVTVAICTLNHAGSLARTLASLVAMAVPSDICWEVLVVNNGSTDATDDVLARFASEVPLRREFEPERGISRARNRAVSAAEGEYIIWTDDDVVVSRGWLTTYISAFRRHPAAAVFGGPIVPRYEVPVPRWILEGEALLRGVFGHWDIGDQETKLWEGGKVRYMPCGPNFALRAAEQHKFRYNLRLGMAPGQRRRGEEIDVLERVRVSGASGYWVPGARVEHCARRDMQTMRYVARCYRSLGETDAFLWGSTAVPMWFGAPRWLWRESIENWLLFCVLRPVAPASVWLGHLRAYSRALGAIRYWRDHRRATVST